MVALARDASKNREGKGVEGEEGRKLSLSHSHTTHVCMPSNVEGPSFYKQIRWAESLTSGLCHATGRLSCGYIPFLSRGLLHTHTLVVRYSVGYGLLVGLHPEPRLYDPTIPTTMSSPLALKLRLWRLWPSVELLHAARYSVAMATSLVFNSEPWL